MGDLNIRGSVPAPPSPPQVTEITTEAKPAQVPALLNSESKAQASPTNKQHAAQQKSEQGMTGSIKKNELDQKLSAKKAESTSATNTAEATQSLPRKATITSKNFSRSEYDFGRPITKEQAAQVIFKDGKLPEGAKLEQGPGPNTWTLRMGEHERDTILRSMRSHYETSDPSKPYTVVAEWPDIPIPPSEATANKRWDLNNDFGFKINNTYSIDEGQQQVKYVNAAHGTGKGKGFELEFEKPMTQQQVMDKLFDKSKLPNGAVKLTPVPYEPATTWRVDIIGADAHEAFKGKIGRAFGSASTNGKEVTRPGIPAGINKHFQNKTVPNDAVKHPPNVYVWEQEGHLVRVEKGNNGYYNHETTKLHPSDKVGNDTIRYFMKDLGMKPREAWQAYVKHWDDIHKGIVTAFALGMASGRAPRKAPTGAVKATPRPAVRSTQKPAARVPEQPVPVNTNGTTLNTKAPTVNTNVKPGNPKAPVKGNSPAVDPHAKTGVDPHAKTAPADSAGKVNTNGTTIDTKPPAKPAPAPAASKGKVVSSRQQLPDNQKITINTADGPKNMTVGEYRRQYRLAQKWRTDQIIFNKRNPYDSKLDEEAAKKFGLNKNWQHINNPYIHPRIN